MVQTLCRALTPGVLAAIGGACLGARTAGLLLAAAATPALPPSPSPPPVVPLDAARTAELFQVPLRAVEQISDDEYRVSRSRLPDLFCRNDNDSCWSYARTVPAFKDGAAIGVKVFSIAPASPYAQMGIENGDIIRRLNGEELSGPDKALDIYGKLRNDARIVVELERKGKTLRKTYLIE